MRVTESRRSSRPPTQKELEAQRARMTRAAGHKEKLSRIHAMSAMIKIMPEGKEKDDAVKERDEQFTGYEADIQSMDKALGQWEITEFQNVERSATKAELAQAQKDREEYQAYLQAEEDKKKARIESIKKLAKSAGVTAREYVEAHSLDVEVE